MEKPLQDEIITDSGLRLYFDSSYSPEWGCAVTATLHALPLNPKYSDLKKKVEVGQEVAFLYDVVADFRFNDDGNYYHEATEGSPYFKKYFNGKGEMLTIVAMPKIISTMWVGAAYDSSGDFIHGCQGTQSEVERWQANFRFGSDDSYTFKNLVEVDGSDYWKCNVESLIAKKVGDKIEAIGSRLLLKPIDVDVKTKMELIEGRPLPFEEMKMRFFDRAYLTHDCDELSLKEGDIVSFEEKYMEKYTLWGNEYFLIKKSRAIGKWLGQ